MAQALGFVTKTGDAYEGTLATLRIKARIRILPNRDKTMAKQPDYRIFTDDLLEVGAGWDRVGKTSGQPYVSLTFAAPEFGREKIYANLGRAAGESDPNVMAILWNPRN